MTSKMVTDSGVGDAGRSGMYAVASRCLLCKEGSFFGSHRCGNPRSIQKQLFAIIPTAAVFSVGR